MELLWEQMRSLSCLPQLPQIKCLESKRSRLVPGLKKNVFVLAMAICTEATHCEPHGVSYRIQC